MGNSWLVALIASTLFSATPLALAAMGGVLSERAGVVNIALEGFMLLGAFVGFYFGLRSAAIGMCAVVIAGALFGALHAFFTQKARMNPVISGLGLNLLIAGATRYLALRLFPQGDHIAGLSPNLFLALAVLTPFILVFTLQHTKFGLRLRAVGENPESARMAGVAPAPPRYAAVMLSGACASIAGAYLSMADARAFTSDMSAGKGYVALAAVIFGKWNPLGAAGGALFFGFFYALQTQLQINQYRLHWLGVEWTSPFLLDCLPYVMTLLALVSVIGKATPPAALSQEE